MHDLKIGCSCGRLIHKSQVAFLQKINITNNVLHLHEILHETKRKNLTWVILKLDFEKAYDKVNWDFLMECLRARGFDDKWCSRIKMVLHDGTIAVKTNNHVGPYFQSHKGVRQGDPLSPLLFNFVVDCLTRMIVKAQVNSLINGLVKHLIPNGVVVLQYADDTIVCLENDMEKASYMKLLLSLYEQMSGLKINFDKSEILLIGGDNNLAVTYAELFNYQIGSFQLQYLGVPILAGRLYVIDWAKLEEKSARKLDVWQGSSLSMAGRTVLINFSLTNSSIYHMSMFLLPKTVIKRMDRGRRKFFWQGSKMKKSYHLIKCDKICRAKKNGGLSIKDPRKLNISLLVKWWWALENEE
jgi:hypothetical protein